MTLSPAGQETGTKHGALGWSFGKRVTNLPDSMIPILVNEILNRIV